MRGKLAKKIRREIKELKYNIASELKGCINGMDLKDRIIFAIKVIFKKRW